MQDAAARFVRCLRVALGFFVSSFGEGKARSRRRLPASQAGTAPHFRKIGPAESSRLANEFCFHTPVFVTDIEMSDRRPPFDGSNVFFIQVRNTVPETDAPSVEGRASIRAGCGRGNVRELVSYRANFVRAPSDRAKCREKT